jgi:[protein-PII] uridylyltransferase
VDLLFLVRRAGAAGTDAVLYPLWDLGFDVGHALRTPADCSQMVSADLTAATALLDSRLLLGDEGLFERTRLKAGIKSGGSREMRRWVRKITADVDARRARFGAISHLLEPHIKEGTGGLRDLQACRWVLTCLGKTWQEELSRLRRGKEISRATRFLDRTRNALHAAAGRKTDHLTFEYHSDVATIAVPGQPIDSFFESLHRASHAVIAAWEEVRSVAHETLLPPRRSIRPQKTLSEPALLADQIHSWCRNGGEMPEEIRRTLIEGDRFAVAGAVRRSAVRVLRSRAPLAPLLDELYRLDLLELFAPELEAVAHQVQYDARHAFTTGIHCIETLRALEDLWLGIHETDEPYLTRIAGAVLNPAVVRLAALCHDLGKVSGTDGHAESGAQIARVVAARLDFDAEEADQVSQLVSAHHVVPATAFGGDLGDRGSWVAFAGAGEDASGADALVAMAYADVIATHPRSWSGVWSDWKRDLLLTFRARVQNLETSPAHLSSQTRHAVAARAHGLQGFDEIWDRMPPRQALQVPPDLLASLLILAASLGDRSAQWRVETRQAGMTEILGVVQPLPRVLSSATGALAQLGFDILSLQVHTWADGTAHLWLRAAHLQGPLPPERVTDSLTQAVIGRHRPKGAEPGGIVNTRNEAMPVKTQVLLHPGENPFYSTLQIRGRDRRGFVRDLTHLFEDLGLTVEHALVTTHGPMAQDVFHLKDIFGGRIDGPDKLRALLDGVGRLIEAPSDHGAS